MRVFDVLVVIACRACLNATTCEVRVGKIANSTFLSFFRNADHCNVSYAGANKWGGLRTEAPFQGGQRTYSFQ